MRAGTWLTHRDLAAARASWRARARRRGPIARHRHRARRDADRPADAAVRQRLAGRRQHCRHRIRRTARPRRAPPATRCRSPWGWPGSCRHWSFTPESAKRPQLASELADLLESIGDPDVDSLGCSTARSPPSYERAELTEAVRLAQRVIDLADGDATMGNFILGSPLAGAIMLRGCRTVLPRGPGLDEAMSSSPRRWSAHSTRRCAR